MAKGRCDARHVGGHQQSPLDRVRSSQNSDSLRTRGSGTYVMWHNIAQEQETKRRGEKKKPLGKASATADEATHKKRNVLSNFSGRGPRLTRPGQGSLVSSPPVGAI